MVTRCQSGKPCRLIRNAFTESWEGREHEIKPFPLQMLQVGQEAARRARHEGKIDEGGMAAGQVSGLIKQVKPAGEVVQDVISEATGVLEKGLYTR